MVEISGSDFETLFCLILKRFGFWALNIPKNRYGAQPFDVIAVNRTHILAVDCKVCSDKDGRFKVSRIEDNQWMAFETIKKRAVCAAGIVIFHDWNVYLYEYEQLAKVCGSVIKTDKSHLLFDEEIVKKEWTKWKQSSVKK